MLGEPTETRYTYGIGCLLACMVVEITSIGCTILYDLDRDETGSNVPMVSYILVSIALMGQLLSCSLACFITRTFDNGEATKFNYGIAFLSLPTMGPLQIAAVILMATSAANNDITSVQGYASVLIALNFLAAILSVAYGVFFYIPIRQEEVYSYNGITDKDDKETV